MPSDRTFSATVADLGSREPDAVAVRCAAEVVTWGELDRRTASIAGDWVLGAVGIDDVVAVAVPAGIDFVVSCVAAWRAGATVLPLRLPPGAEREAVLALVATKVVLDQVPRAVPATGDPLPDRAASSWKLTLSSGSTGRPKLVRSTAPARLDPTRLVAEFVPRRAVQLVGAPIAHGASFVYAMRGLLTGHELVVMPEFDAGEWLRLVPAYGVTWAPLNPHLMREIWRHPDRAAADLSSLQSILHVGARCPDDLKRDWIDWLGPDRIVEVYAGTESQGVACIGGREWLAHPGSVGRGVGGTEFGIVRADGGWAGADELGEIVMRRPGTAYSYLGADVEIRTIAGEPGWHTLGDVGRLDAEGYLYVGDRLVDLIATPHGPVQPADVEAVVDAHPAVRSCAVIGRGTGLHAVVESAGVTAAELDAWVASRLPPYQRPTSWHLVDHAVRDAAGKVRRSAHT